MNRTSRELMHRLRAADPANDATPPLPIELRSTAKRKILASSPDDDLRFRSLGPARRSFAAPILVAAAVVAVGILAVILAPVLWPDRATSAMAYGITVKPDGTVDVLLRWADFDDAARAQARLQAAGVPAVVLKESAGCAEAITGQDETDAVETVATSAPDRVGVIVRPSKLPSGSYVVFGLPSLGLRVEGVVSVFVTRTPPRCLADANLLGPVPRSSPS